MPLFYCCRCQVDFVGFYHASKMWQNFLTWSEKCDKTHVHARHEQCCRCHTTFNTKTLLSVLAFTTCNVCEETSYWDEYAHHGQKCQHNITWALLSGGKLCDEDIHSVYNWGQDSTFHQFLMHQSCQPNTVCPEFRSSKSEVHLPKLFTQGRVSNGG